MAAASDPGPGPRNSITDIKGLQVGHATDPALKSGATVLVADAPFTASVHVMGGAPGTRETDLLAPDKSVGQVDALVLSGGSAFGLDACSGVMDGLRAMGRGLEVGAARVPLVAGAILFDLLNGGDKGWDANPYGALGREALEAASGEVALGSVGAGTGALSGSEKGGLGTASLRLSSGVTVAALVAANPVGSVRTPGGHFWAAPFEIGKEFGGLGVDPRSYAWAVPTEKMAAMGRHERGNTTIAIVATDAPLTKTQCHRLAVSAHDGIARAVQPAHTPHDGDLVFAAATGDGSGVEMPLAFEIGVAAALCLSRAIARGVWEARATPGDLLPTVSGL